MVFISAKYIYSEKNIFLIVSADPITRLSHVIVLQDCQVFLLFRMGGRSMAWVNKLAGRKAGRDSIYRYSGTT